MIRAYKLFTGPDGNSHTMRGGVADNEVFAAETISFAESPPHSASDWHHDPAAQYVIMLSGVLEFANVTGETFRVYPGEILIVLDSTGTGHKWRLVNDEPWKRAYIRFKDASKPNFVPEGKTS
jgi:quercetin dioxygenase-like cupin family protein